MRWSVVMPVYNEAALLRETLGSLLVQSRPIRLIVVDNGSTDASAAIAREIASCHDADLHLLHEPQPGQVYALHRGIAAVATELVAICDADTIYPVDYLARAEHMFDEAGSRAVAVCAWPAHENHASSLASQLSALHRLTAIRWLPHQNHVNGGSHCFRMAALQAAGGYDPARWPFVLKDHELMAQMLAQGTQVAARHHYCTPSTRRTDRRAVRWTLAERAQYHLTPAAGQLAFFRDWLGPRFAARGQADIVLRQRPWIPADEPA